jgi:uncharacterized membrane protein YecN with MAPEG domain
VSPIYIGLSALLLIVLSAQVMRLRGKHRVGVGDGGQADLQLAIRVQGNFVEYVPIALLLLLCVDLVGDSKWIVHVLGLSLLVGRVLHAYGLSRSAGESFGRAAGTVLTLLVLIAGAVLAILGAFNTRVLF